jgi:WD40 repeat protein/energy-coupling factor transporter ATP-binding protein EcfA2
MDNENNEDQTRVQADNNSIAVGGINIGGDISGNITIGHVGYTVEQVSVLLTQITSTFQPKLFDGRCPYKGLDVFEEDDAELFFGREKLVDDLVSRVKESRTIFITGPSGSGKSSLVRAGLIHNLKNGAIKGSERWLYETMKPGREPIKDLALAFSRLKSPNLADYFKAHASEKDVLNKCAESVLSGRKDQHFLLFIDQFEEVFTQMSQEEERVAFINMLAHAGAVENGRVIILFAMRSDFVSNCATYPALNEMLSQQFRQIGAMQPQELVSAIALPAKHVGLPIEDELIARIINDMKGEPGALPLMQFALKDLLDSQEEKGGVIALMLEDYLRHGGIHKSLERHADRSFATFSENEQELARSIFSGLIEIGRGTQDTRRIAFFDELVPANVKATEVESVVQRLADARLIITDEQAGKDTVTISHEKLIDAWPWLKKLVNENRDVIALQNEIASDAKEWDDHNRDASYLYTGARLATAQEQLEAKNLVLSGSAYEYIRAGSAQQKRRQRTARLGIAAVGVALTVAVAIFSLQASTNAKIASTAQAVSTDAVAQKGTAQAASTIAVAQAQISRTSELAAQSVETRERDFQLSLLLAMEAFRSQDTVRSRAALLDATIAHPQLLDFLVGHVGGVSSVAFSPDGKTIASGSDDNTIILWDVETHQPIGQPLTGHTTSVTSVAFSPDGKTLATGSWGSTIILWNVKTRQPIGQPLTEHIKPVISVAFSTDGSTLASGSDDNTIILWDVETHQPIGQPLVGHAARIVNIAFSPDDNTLASGSYDNTIILWNVKTRQPIGRPLTGHTNIVLSVAFSPDGDSLASGGGNHEIMLWDVKTHQPIGQPLTGQADFVTSVTFSPDGAILASGGDDNTIILWDVEARHPIGQPLTGHTNSVESVAFSPDGKTIASGSSDNTIILWDADARQPISQSLTEDAGVAFSVAFSPDGKTLAGGFDTTIILWDAPEHEPLAQAAVIKLSSYIFSLAFSQDDQILATTSCVEEIGDNPANFDCVLGQIFLYDVKTGQPLGDPLIGHNGWVRTVAFSPDGKTLASGSDDNTIILWDVESRQPIGQPFAHPLTEHIEPVSSVAFSPDGKSLASGSGDNTIILWDVATRQPIGQPLTGHTSAVESVAFSPDGKTIASTSWDATIILWDVETHQPIGQPLTGHTSFVRAVAFSPDGKTLASGSDDNTIILWDVGSRQPIGQPFIGHSDILRAVAFSPDGKTLASGSDDNTIILWEVSPEYWIEQTCQRVGRNFTRAEWNRYFANDEYRKTCEQWPLEPEIIVTAIP